MATLVNEPSDLWVGLVLSGIGMPLVGTMATLVNEPSNRLGGDELVTSMTRHVVDGMLASGAACLTYSSHQ